ncbi:hypothetical protein ACRAWG_01380 [Methylobacterium sp. P31]
MHQAHTTHAAHHHTEASRHHRPGERLAIGTVNPYCSDGFVAVAELSERSR